MSCIRPSVDKKNNNNISALTLTSEGIFAKVTINKQTLNALIDAWPKEVQDAVAKASDRKRRHKFLVGDYKVMANAKGGVKVYKLGGDCKEVIP